MRNGTVKRLVLLLAVPLLTLAPRIWAEEPSVSDAAAAEQTAENGVPPEEKHPLGAPPDRSAAAPWGGSVTRSLTGLFFVLALLFAFFYVAKRWTPAGKRLCPEAFFQTMAVFPISGRVQGRVVRFGPKILLLAVSRDRVTPLAELTDPEQIASLAAALPPSGSRQGEEENPKEAGQ
ncbi:MAG: FliO/MopB family protein [Thermoguttaceae bacterium]|nr:FliO/MopB family protein [Thermoguttaceae bacterium]